MSEETNILLEQNTIYFFTFQKFPYISHLPKVQILSRYKNISLFSTLTLNF